MLHLGVSRTYWIPAGRGTLSFGLEFLFWLGSVQLIVKGLDIIDHTISTIKQNNSYLKIVDSKNVIVFNL